MKPTFYLVLAGATLLANVLLTGCATAEPAGIGSSFKGPVGLQLYSLRAQFGKDVPGTLDVVKGFGIKGKIVGIESRTRGRIRILEGAQIYQTISVEYQDGDLVYP